MIAAGGRHHSCVGYFAKEQIGERATRLERAGVLEKLQFQAEGGGIQAEIGGIDLNDRCFPDMIPDELVGTCDSLSVDDGIEDLWDDFPMLLHA